MTVLSLAIIIGGEVVRSGMRMEEKDFYVDLSREWPNHHTSELIIKIGDFDGHAGRNIDGFHRVHVGIIIGE